MARYIDADVLRHAVLYHANVQYCKGNYDKEEAFTYCLYLIDCMPISDVAEVVRCKDCRYWQDNQEGHYPNELCPWDKNETPDEDDYCSLGEHKILPKD